MERNAADAAAKKELNYSGSGSSSRSGSMSHDNDSGSDRSRDGGSHRGSPFPSMAPLPPRACMILLMPLSDRRSKVNRHQHADFIDFILPNPMKPAKLFSALSTYFKRGLAAATTASAAGVTPEQTTTASASYLLASRTPGLLSSLYGSDSSGSSADVNSANRSQAGYDDRSSGYGEALSQPQSRSAAYYSGSAAPPIGITTNLPMSKQFTPPTGSPPNSFTSPPETSDGYAGSSMAPFATTFQQIGATMGMGGGAVGRERVSPVGMQSSPSPGEINSADSRSTTSSTYGEQQEQLQQHQQHHASKRGSNASIHAPHPAVSDVSIPSTQLTTRLVPGLCRHPEQMRTCPRACPTRLTTRPSSLPFDRRMRP